MKSQNNHIHGNGLSFVSLYPYMAIAWRHNPPAFHAQILNTTTIERCLARMFLWMALLHVQITYLIISNLIYGQYYCYKLSLSTDHFSINFQSLLCALFHSISRTFTGHFLDKLKSAFIFYMSLCSLRHEDR